MSDLTEPRFQRCVAFVLGQECVYLDQKAMVEHDPNDPGGTTFCGIDQRDHPHVDVSHLTIDAVKEIYRANEWTKMQCARMKPFWDLACFDSAVNPGFGWAPVALQRVLGVTVDGFIGPKTIAAVNGAALDDLSRYLNAREAYYRARPESLRTHYLNGWLNRVNALRKVCGLSQTNTDSSAPHSPIAPLRGRSKVLDV